MTTMKKCQFAKVNDKRYYFSDGIVFLPFGHPYLSGVRKYKNESAEKLEDFFVSNKFEILRLKNNAILKNERLHVLRSILLQPITYRKLDFGKRLLQDNFSKGIYTTTRDYILNSRWL